MSSLSTFGAFTTARLAIYASQKALDVVGNNIGNVNTTGYTRQVLDQVSLFMGGADKYQNGLDARVGNGALVTGVSQLRDPYLDIRYRNETSTVGFMDGKMNGLNQLSNILDEVAKGEDADGELGVLELRFNDLIKQFQKLNTQGAGLDTFDTNVRTSAGALATLFNSYANRLEELRQNQERGFQDDLDKVNGILTSIRSLNESIRKSSIFGGDSLEQRDLRNNLIDELSKYVRVDVTYELEKLGGGMEVEKLVIRLAGDDTNPKTGKPEINNAVLIDGIYGAQLSEAGRNGGYMITVGALMDQHNRVQVLKTDKDGHQTLSTPVTLTDNTLYGALQAQREMLTEQGEFATGAQLNMDPKANVKRGIPYYQKALDVLANQFAHLMNRTNQEGRVLETKADAVAGQVYADDIFKINGKYYKLATTTGADGVIRLKVDPNVNPTPNCGEEILRVGENGKITTSALTADQIDHILPAALGGQGHIELTEIPASDLNRKGGGVLFSNSGNGDDTRGITAANISISKSWGEGTVRIQKSLDPNATSTDNTNLNTFLDLLQNQRVGYLPTGADLAGTKNFQDGAPSSTDVFFTGTFQEMFTENICGTLAADRDTTNTLLDNHSTSADELYVDRDAISGVDLNDEAINMMQFQKSLNAAYRLMTTIDEALDRLINNTGIVGR